jgi:hypothetical protein
MTLSAVWSPACKTNAAQSGNFGNDSQLARTEG